MALNVNRAEGGRLSQAAKKMQMGRNALQFFQPRVGDQIQKTQICNFLGFLKKYFPLTTEGGGKKNPANLLFDGPMTDEYSKKRKSAKYQLILAKIQLGPAN